MYALAILSIVVLAGQAVATPSFGAGHLAALLKRQSALDPSQIPAQCQSQCTSVTNSLSTCTDLSCLCADSVNKGLYNCLECALGLQPDASLLSQAQSSLTQYEQACTQGGVAVTPLTLTLPNGAAAPTASGSKATTAAAGSIALTGTGTAAAGTVNTAAASTNTAASGSNANPLSHNGAGAIGASVASVAGVAIAVAALL